MRRFAVGLALLLVLAGCTTAPSPRATERDPLVTADVYPRLVTECVRRVPGMGGVELRVLQPMPADVQLRIAEPGRQVTPERLALMERELELCLERYPLDLDLVSYHRTEFNDRLLYQYYVGPLSTCLKEHGIDLGEPPSLGEFRHRDFARNPYTALRWSVERLATIRSDCPPIPPFLLDDDPVG